MAAFEVIALDTATPQLRAPGASDTYTFPRAVEMPLGTANGVLYLNGSKVVTSGSALTFDGTTLTNTRNTTDGTSAALTLNNSGATGSYATLNLTAGSVTYQQFADAAGNAIGTAGVMFRTTSNHPLIWGINNAEQMRLTSTGLGIGESNPAGKLSVNVDASTELITFRSSGGRQIWAHEPGANARPLTIKAQTLTYADDTATRLVVDSSGNVGLGVTPSAWGSDYRTLQIGQGAAFSGRTNNFAAAVISANAYYTTQWDYLFNSQASYYEQNAGVHKWYTAPSGTAGAAISFTQAMTLDASGNLGVGTTSPATYGKLAVESGANAIVARSGSSTFCEINVQSGSTDAVKGQFQAIEGSTNKVIIGARTNHPLAFNTNDTERARITSGGDLLVGTLSNGSASRMVVAGTATGANQRVLQVLSITSGDISNAALLVSKYDNDSTTSQVYVQFSMNNDGTSSGQINANGANQAAFGSWSDARLKENIVDLPPQLGNIMALRPVEFDYIESEGGGHQISFIAQEFEQVYPDAVGERADGMKTLSGWDKTTARLVKAIQEQQALITALTARVAALEV